jgi:hypothetical protein
MIYLPGTAGGDGNHEHVFATAKAGATAPAKQGSN